MKSHMKGPKARQFMPPEMDEYETSRPKSTYNIPANKHIVIGRNNSCNKLRLVALTDVPVIKNRSVQAKEDCSFLCQEANTVMKNSSFMSINEKNKDHKCLNLVELAVPYTRQLG
mmetsp:Transcript_31518/g.58686  ORF Transcript_31518/g.58686 Transcript_31518/m.58686 type:complete len:115 (+) Transcript_31518:247-591(+)